MLRMEKLLPELLQDRRVQAEMDAIRQEPGNEHLTKDGVALANEWFRRKLAAMTPEQFAKLESKEGIRVLETLLGLPNGSFEGETLMLVYFPDPYGLNAQNPERSRVWSEQVLDTWRCAA